WRCSRPGPTSCSPTCKEKRPRAAPGWSRTCARAACWPPACTGCASSRTWTWMRRAWTVPPRRCASSCRTPERRGCRMPDAHQLLLFVVAGLLLNLTPGVDVFFIVSRALRQGVRAGLIASLGITAGCCAHIVAAALGVSALVAASATAFMLLKWAGAAYLVWIGIGMLRAREPALAAQMAAGGRAGAAGLAPGEGWQVFRRGFLTNALNPKVALFFLAFVP